MAYNKDGKKQYTLKEKIKYHTDCVLTGVDGDGVKLDGAQRLRHGVLAEKRKVQLNRFMNKPEAIRKAIIEESKNKR